MIKRYKRKISRGMRRTSRIYLNHANKGKKKELKEFLNLYTEVINYYIKRFWSEKDESPSLSPKEVTKPVEARFGITAGLSQCAAKQSKEIIRSQKEKSRRKRRMPRFKSHIINLDSRLVKIEEFDGSFEVCTKFRCGIPKLTIPFNWTKHTNKYLDNGWSISNSARLGYNKIGLFVEIIFEKERPPKRTEGKVLGIDRGFNSMLYTSDRQDIGNNIKDKVKVVGKRRNGYHHYVETEEFRALKELDLTDVKLISLEMLNFKGGKRGKFSRKWNRFLSFWHYAKVGNKLVQRCEELGISINFKNPAYTSQRCPSCGKIDKKNRKGKEFLCLECGFEEDSDYIGAKNLEILGLAGVYSLRLLSNQSTRNDFL